jgi:acyl dehydratase
VKTFSGADELRAAAGTHVGFSAWRTISQDDVDAFADVTGDHQWIHVDVERAAAGAFGRTIVHGWFTVALAPLFMAEVFEVRGVTMLINYGVDKLRFLTPVPTGSRLRGGVEITGIDDGPRGILLRATVTTELDGADKPACIAETLSLVVP